MPANKDASQIIEGTVVATGPGVPLPVAISGIGGLQTLANQPVVVKVNEHVVFKQYAGTSIKVNGEELFLLNQKDLLSAIDYEEK